MEVLRALAALSEPPGPESARLADLLELGEVPPAAAWSDLFLFRLYPYASVYLGADGHIGGEARDRVAGFWRALGLEPPSECDHLATMLGFQAELGERQARARDGEERRRWRHVRSAFLCEHLLTWLPPFLIKLELVAPPFFRAWGRLLGEALAAEASATARPTEEPLHWRSAPPLADPRAAGGEAFLRSLLTPAASGLLLIVDDLGRAGRELGLALRVGERRFLLETLLAQAPQAVLEWLAAECRDWRGRLAATRPDGLSAGPFWIDRAAASGEMLSLLAVETADSPSPLL